MSQTVSDVLPIDAGTQKFMAPVDPTTGTFALLWAMAKQTISGKTFAALGTLPVWATDTSHSGESVGTTPVARGAGGSATAAIDCRGFDKVTVFAAVTGLGDGGSVAISLVPRYTQTGDDYGPATVVGSALVNGNQAVEVDVITPYVMVEATASAGTATVTCAVYLHR